MSKILPSHILFNIHCDHQAVGWRTSWRFLAFLQNSIVMSTPAKSLFSLIIPYTPLHHPSYQQTHQTFTFFVTFFPFILPTAFVFPLMRITTTTTITIVTTHTHSTPLTPFSLPLPQHTLTSLPSHLTSLVGILIHRLHTHLHRLEHTIANTRALSHFQLYLRTHPTPRIRGVNQKRPHLGLPFISPVSSFSLTPASSFSLSSMNHLLTMVSYVDFPLATFTSITKW